MAAGAATSGAGGRAGFGWVILVAALAVPGVLFYNWWSHLKAERERSVAAKARGRVPEGGVFQQAPPTENKLVNPMSAAAVSTMAVAAAAPTAANPGGTPTVAAPAAAAVKEPAAAPAQPGANSAQDAAILAANGGAPAAATAPATSTAALIAPLKRDPMMSPLDLVRMMEEEEARRLAKERLEAERNRKTRAPVKRVVDPRTLVDLQGIISNPEGESKAIVNNEVVGAGESVGKGIRVVRITNAGVTFEYQGKKFTKSVNRDD